MILWDKWTQEKTSQWDTQNGVSRDTSRWRCPPGNQKSESQTEQPIVQGRVIGTTWNSRSYMKQLDVAGSGGYEAGQRPQREGRTQHEVHRRGEARRASAQSQTATTMSFYKQKHKRTSLCM